MLISLEKKLAIFAMPKCASSAIHAEFSRINAIRLAGSPDVKHTNYITWRRHLVPYLESLGFSEFETVCLFREPLDWLESHWRYRQRPAARSGPNSTTGVSFEEFVELYVDGRRRPANLRSPARFVTDETGAVGIDRIWRYDHIDEFFAYVRGRLGRPARPKTRNVSPSRPPQPVSAELRARFREHAAREYEIYERVAL